MDFRHLEVFVSIAEQHSFSKAADQLYLSQSTISLHLKNLEHELDCRLINRSTKQVSLTPEGETFCFYAKRILETRDAALAALEAPADTFIRLGASTIPSAYLLPPLLSDFRRKRSDIFFDIRQNDSSKILDSVLDGTVDLGIIGKKEADRKCIYIPLCEDEIVIATPATKHYLTYQTSRPDLRKLLSEPIILRETGSGTQKSADLFLRNLGISEDQLTVTARANDPETIKQMIQQGIGISVMSGFATQDCVSQGKLLTVPLNSSIRRTFYLVYLKEKKPRPILTHFIRFAQDYFNKK